MAYVGVSAYVYGRDWVVANGRSQLGGAFEFSDYVGKGFREDGEPRWEGKVRSVAEGATNFSHK